MTTKLNRAAYSLISLVSVFFIPQTVMGDINLRVQTDFGGFDIVLFDSIAPVTVSNFMGYVNRGDYDRTFIHRSVPGFVVQGGGYIFDSSLGDFLFGGAVHIPTQSPIVNEFNLSNLRGTLAMAKVDGDPNSATSEWFVNMADNSANLDTQNGGFTVFGEVLRDGMNVLDEIEQFPRCIDAAPIPAFCGSFPELPVINTVLALTDDTLININHIGADNEGDGAIDSLEDAGPNSGDANNDGVLDSTQQHVASFQSASGEYVYIETPPSSPLSSLDILGITFAIAYPDSTGVHTGLEFNQGYFGFNITSVATGTASTAAISLPVGLNAGTYMNFGPTENNPVPHWYEFLFDGETGAEFSGNLVTLHYVDGKRGDSDNQADGTITASRGGPATLIADSDGDSVPDSIEDNAPNNGDGNSDGIQDSIQAHVASLTETDQASYLTVESGATTNLRSLQFSSALNFLTPDSQLNGLNFAHDFLAFEVLNISMGGSVEINIILPAGEVPVTFYKYGPTPDNPVDHLYEFIFDGETGAEFNGNVVTLHFVDGKRGDSDLKANGTIVDPGAPALRAAITGAGGGGGGCTFSKDGLRPSQASAWWLLLALFCLHGIQRRYRRTNR